MPIYTKVSGAWKELSAVYVKVSGAWKSCRQVYVKVSGVWKPCWLVTGTETMNIGELKYNESVTIENVKVGSTLTMSGYIYNGWTSDIRAKFIVTGASPSELWTPYDYAGNSEYTDTDPTWFNNLTVTATDTTVTFHRDVPNNIAVRTYDLSIAYTYAYYPE